MRIMRRSGYYRFFIGIVVCGTCLFIIKTVFFPGIVKLSNDGRPTFEDKAAESVPLNTVRARVKMVSRLTGNAAPIDGPQGAREARHPEFPLARHQLATHAKKDKKGKAEHPLMRNAVIPDALVAQRIIRQPGNSALRDMQVAEERKRGHHLHLVVDNIPQKDTERAAVKQLEHHLSGDEAHRNTNEAKPKLVNRRNDIGLRVDIGAAEANQRDLHLTRKDVLRDSRVPEKKHLDVRLTEKDISRDMLRARQKTTKHFMTKIGKPGDIRAGEANRYDGLSTRNDMTGSAQGAGANHWQQVNLPPNLRYMEQPLDTSVIPSTRRKIIVVFNRPEWLFSEDPQYRKVFDTCPYSCQLTDDQSLIPHADAVFADICRLNAPGPPATYRPPHQMWVAYSIESPVHYMGQHDNPAWKAAFNWTFSYRTDSDFFRPYGRFSVRAPPVAKDYTGIVQNKTRPVAWFVSNCHSSSRREEYVKRLQRYIDVDVYGNCGSFVCPGLAEEKCFKILNSSYHFYLSFENSFCQDYVTEKLFKIYNSINIIPVVRGGANYSQFLPPNTYVNAADFSTPQQLAQHLHSVIRDKDRYVGMLRAKDNFHTSFDSWVKPNLRPFCELCQRLQSPSQLTPKVYPDIMQWSSTDKCWSANDV